MSRRGGNRRGITRAKRDVFDSRYIANITRLSISISSTDILFLSKCKKGKSPKMDLPLLKKQHPKYFGT
jgi:hypothetical protein